MKTALIIEDDSEYRKLMAGLVEQHGWHVLQAEEGEEGIKLAKAHRPDVVLCDLLMARCNGFQVCRTLRRVESLRHIKIIVTSGRDFESDRQAALAAGADEYLTKPIDPGQLNSLLARFGRLLGDAEPVPAKSAPAAAATRVKFWGVRGSIPTPGPTTVKYGGNTSCIEVRGDGQIIILDAGTGLRLLGRDLVAEFDHESLELTLLLTHTHWDHIQGLPFFLPVYKPQNQLRILGFEGARQGLDSILTSQMENPFFPIGLRELPANVRIEELKDMQFSIGKVRVEACFANHPGICVGYRLFTSVGSVAFFPDNELHHSPSSQSEGAGATEIAALQFAQNQDKKIIDFIRGTDVLIMDSQYDAQEYRQHTGWGHGCVDDVAALAMDAGVKQLFLFHHDPNHDDEKIGNMVAHARKLVAKAGSKLIVEAASEGQVVELTGGS